MQLILFHSQMPPPFFSSLFSLLLTPIKPYKPFPVSRSLLCTTETFGKHFCRDLPCVWVSCSPPPPLTFPLPFCTPKPTRHSYCLPHTTLSLIFCYIGVKNVKQTKAFFIKYCGVRKEKQKQKKPWQTCSVYVSRGPLQGWETDLGTRELGWFFFTCCCNL